MKKCPQCGYDNIDDYEYCGKCGLTLNTTILCPFCNAQNNSENISCINCGKTLNTNIISQTTQENQNYQQYNSINTNKIDLKALLVGSISISIIFYILVLIITSLFNNYYITTDGSALLYILSMVVSGIIGMIIFNKINREENRPRNIIFASALGTIILFVIGALTGGYGFNFLLILLVFICFVIGSFIGDYIEKNGKI